MSCYNCGILLNEENRTAEHIPAKNLFDGFSENYKLNRITVDGCFNCNNLFSKIDNEIRDALAIKTEELASRKLLAEKGTRSITRNSNWLDRATFDTNGNIISIDFKYKGFVESHIKNFKGIFYHKNKFHIGDDFQIEIISEKESTNYLGLLKILTSYLDLYGKFEHSGHPDIFKYKFVDMTLNKTNNFSPSANIDLCSAIVCQLIYHNEILAIVFAKRKDGCFADS